MKSMMLIEEQIEEAISNEELTMMSKWMMMDERNEEAIWKADDLWAKVIPQQQRPTRSWASKATWLKRISCVREFSHLSEYDVHTNEIFWVSNASLLCNGRLAERWRQSNLYQACTFEKNLKNSMRLPMFRSWFKLIAHPSESGRKTVPSCHFLGLVGNHRQGDNIGFSSGWLQ